MSFLVVERGIVGYRLVVIDPSALLAGHLGLLVAKMWSMSFLVSLDSIAMTSDDTSRRWLACWCTGCSKYLGRARVDGGNSVSLLWRDPDY